ncbi:hypothetical protein P9112_012073 [Eukaryota sp. TZLM1-RC]
MNHTMYITLRWIMDFSFLVAPIIFGVNSLSKAMYLPLLFLLFDNVYSPHRVPSISTTDQLFKSFVQLFTTLCILAVDFPSFVQTFAKSSFRGNSLMDLGIGSTVFIKGFTSKQNNSNRTVFYLACFLSRCILIHLFYSQGVITMGEYGTFWNFFLSMFILELFWSLLDHTFVVQYSFFSCLCLSFISFHFLRDSSFLTTLYHTKQSSSSNLFFQNYSGIVGLFGLFSIRLGSHSLFKSRNNFSSLILKQSLFTFIYLIFSLRFKPSVKLVDGVYVTWVLSVCGWLWLGCFLLSGWIDITKHPLITSLGRNMTSVFVFSNLLTGVFNVVFLKRGVFFNRMGAISVLTIYMFLVCVFALLKCTRLRVTFGFF